MSGVTILPNQVLVSRWFHARVGLVNGIVLAATAFGAAMAPALITRLIEALDWRTAFMMMAGIATVPPLVVVLLIVRSRPEEMGLRPYGSGTAAAPAPPLAGIALADAARLPAFWIFAGAIFLGGMPCYSFNKHILVFLKDLGFDPSARPTTELFRLGARGSSSAGSPTGSIAATSSSSRSCSSPPAIRSSSSFRAIRSAAAGVVPVRRRLRRTAVDPHPHCTTSPPPPRHDPRRVQGVI